MSENKRFVMLVERNKKGRYVKNESYSIEEFMKQIDTERVDGLHIGETKPTIFNRLFNFDKLLKEQAVYSYQDGYVQGHIKTLTNAKAKINSMIDLDSFGKKKKR